MIYNMTSLIHSKKFEKKLETLINLLNNRTSENYVTECFVYFNTVNIIIHNIEERKFKRFSVTANMVLEENLSGLSIMILKSYNKR